MTVGAAKMTVAILVDKAVGEPNYAQPHLVTGRFMSTCRSWSHKSPAAALWVTTIRAASSRTSGVYFWYFPATKPLLSGLGPYEVRSPEFIAISESCDLVLDRSRVHIRARFIRKDVPGKDRNMPIRRHERKDIPIRIMQHLVTRARDYWSRSYEQIREQCGELVRTVSAHRAPGTRHAI
jgi:hypothetical protein